MRTYIKKAQPPAPSDKTKLEEAVRAMLADIAQNRDEAIRRYAKQFDKWDNPEFKVSPDQIRKAERELPETFKADFKYALRQVTSFAKKQLETLQNCETEIEPGIVLGQKMIPISRVGCRVPSGKFPLVASAIMSVGTAKSGGCRSHFRLRATSDASGMYNYTLYALATSGADEIYNLGGAQAMAAMVHGCVGMKAVDLITGAGNPFVAEAKRQLFGQVGIDLLAGPTEILIVADESADPSLVATDLLGPAEHGPDSPAWRDHGEIMVVENDAEAVIACDEYAPEHLEVMTSKNDYYLKNLENYGSLFVGEESTVAYGDQGIGTNHPLPTAKAARFTGGLWAGKFIKTLTYQHLTKAASREIAPIMGRICVAEGMIAHGITADVREKRYRTEDK
ncbi:MAG: histidinol dehydrogenase [Burkholderiales bacterium]